MDTACCDELTETQEDQDGIRLPRLVSDGMVLQRDTEIKIWGWAASGQKLSVRFLGREYHTAADSNGKWMVLLPVMQAGGPYTMEIQGEKTITIKDILVGDVWICSGQSNMEITMQSVEDIYTEDIARCENPMIRLFRVPIQFDFKAPRQDLPTGGWKHASPENIQDFTAVGYYFAKKLFEAYNIPIGIISASVGGSPIEAWLSEEALQGFPEFLKVAKQFEDDNNIQRIIKADKEAEYAWYENLRDQDQGLEKAKGDLPWYDDQYDDSGWSTMQMPTLWADEGLEPMCGIVWFRKEIDVPASMAGKSARLLLGRMVDADTTYVNGTVVGTTENQYIPRKYHVPAYLLKEGKNVIVIRVACMWGGGAFIKDKPYQLYVEGQVIDLQGEWKYKIGAVSGPFPAMTYFTNQPLGLFNGMMAPLLNYQHKGIAWYQGESNATRSEGYHKLFFALINDWRKKWMQGDFPFLFVQLPNYKPACDQPYESEWALLREEQMKALDLPNTAMIVTIDLGEWNDIHPFNKRDVGYRLALAAQYAAYGDRDVVYSGPIFQSMKVEEEKVILSFTNTGGGLIAKGSDELKHFAIAGPDKVFVWGNAEIKGDQVVVWSKKVKNPVAIRYAWADNPEGANLYNREGLPASPFRIGG